LHPLALLPELLKDLSKTARFGGQGFSLCYQRGIKLNLRLEISLFGYLKSLKTGASPRKNVLLFPLYPFIIPGQNQPGWQVLKNCRPKTPERNREVPFLVLF
jgi:hypothetical protein